MAGLITPAGTLTTLDRSPRHLALDELTVACLAVHQLRRQVPGPGPLAGELARLEALLAELGTVVQTLREGGGRPLAAGPGARLRDDGAHIPPAPCAARGSVQHPAWWGR